MFTEELVIKLNLNNNDVSDLVWRHGRRRGWAIADSRPPPLPPEKIKYSLYLFATFFSLLETFFTMWGHLCYFFLLWGGGGFFGFAPPPPPPPSTKIFAGAHGWKSYEDLALNPWKSLKDYNDPPPPPKSFWLQLFSYNYVSNYYPRWYIYIMCYKLFVKSIEN